MRRIAVAMGLGLAALAAIAFGPVAPRAGWPGGANGGRHPMKEDDVFFMRKGVAAEARVPPIDAAAPARTEKATFALG